MTQTIADALTEIDAISAQAAERDREAVQHREAAQRASIDAEQLAQQAADTARLTENEVLRRFTRIMRELSSEVDTARKHAVDAVRRGEKVTDAWVTYRLVANRARGRWTVLSGEYQRLTGRDAPYGPNRPELRAEPFEKFLHTAIVKAEQQAYSQAQGQAQAELNAWRDSQAT